MSFDIDQEEAEECYRERAMLHDKLDRLLHVNLWLLGTTALLLLILAIYTW